MLYTCVLLQPQSNLNNQTPRSRQSFQSSYSQDASLCQRNSSNSSRCLSWYACMVYSTAGPILFAVYISRKGRHFNMPHFAAKCYVAPLTNKEKFMLTNKHEMSTMRTTVPIITRMPVVVSHRSRHRGTQHNSELASFQTNKQTEIYVIHTDESYVCVILYQRIWWISQVRFTRKIEC
jgi:hypothetical protein